MRTGLVIEYDSLADFARACSLNTLLWGGYHNPIIPVGPSTALANLLLACFKVDALIPVSDGEAVNHFLMRNETRYPRGLERGTFFQPDWRTKKNRLIFLDAINVVDDLWETTFKYQKAGEHSECCLVHWDPEDPLHTVLGAMFGSYPNDSGLDVDYTAAFRNGLYSQDVPVIRRMGFRLSFFMVAPRFSLQCISSDTKGHGFVTVPASWSDVLIPSMTSWRSGICVQRETTSCFCRLISLTGARNTLVGISRISIPFPTFIPQL